MSMFLAVLYWLVIASLAVAAILTLIRLTTGDAAPGKAKPGERATAWRLLCYCLGVALSCGSQLVNGASSWTLLGISICLIGVAFSWELRLLFMRASRA